MFIPQLSWDDDDSRAMSRRQLGCLVRLTFHDRHGAPHACKQVGGYDVARCPTNDGGCTCDRNVNGTRHGGVIKHMGVLNIACRLMGLPIERTERGSGVEEQGRPELSFCDFAGTVLRAVRQQHAHNLYNAFFSLTRFPIQLQLFSPHSLADPELTGLIEHHTNPSTTQALPPSTMADIACASCNKVCRAVRVSDLILITETAAEVPNMKRCAKCTTTPYCSRECQVADWKAHKKTCAASASASAASTLKVEHSTSYKSPRVKGLQKHVPNPFTCIDRGTYLHDRPERDVYKLLIDTFRMRQADDLKMNGVTTPNTVYTGAASSIGPFRAFLGKVEARGRVLPAWWNAEKRKECEEFAESGGDRSSVRSKVTKEEVISQYGDQRVSHRIGGLFKMLGAKFCGRCRCSCVCSGRRRCSNRRRGRRWGLGSR